MALIPSTAASFSTGFLYEPLPRTAHVSGCVGNAAVVHGGLREKGKQCLSSAVEIYDPYTELWEQRHVEGDAPCRGIFWAASASWREYLFTFGGWDGKQRSSAFNRLDTKNWRWCEIMPKTTEGAPMPKLACAMITFGNCVGVLGGHGLPQGPTKPRPFMKDTRFADGSGWTNEFHIYHLHRGKNHCR